MVQVIDPKVTVLNVGPEHTTPGGLHIGPDAFVWGAAQITYKDSGALRELIDVRASQGGFEEKLRSALIAIAGAGHASMATTPGLWTYFEGNCSKFVDSMFTGIRFGSSLMPSGRRVPIAEDQILVPKSIVDAGKTETDMYMEASRKNIQAYEKVQEVIPKQEASKIVQYGHRGGGFLFLPLETIINLSIDAERDMEATPREAFQILDQLREQIHQKGMGNTYEARMAAPRTGVPNPTIFHRRENLATEVINENRGGVLDKPVLLSSSFVGSNELNLRISNFLSEREDIFEDPERIANEWEGLLYDLDAIVQDFDPAVNVVTATNTPWRVWGEVKRHRTMPQNVEGVYHAAQRALDLIKEEPSGIYDFQRMRQVVSIPPGLYKSPEHLELWMERFADSLLTYEALVQMGVPESDATAVIPRGLKVGIVKQYGLYNLTTGYMSLRLCNSAEPEMKATTEEEVGLIMCSESLPELVEELMVPKCGFTGFCPEKKTCKHILEFDPTYDGARHKLLAEQRTEEIRTRLL